MFLYAGRNLPFKANAEPEYETIDEADLKDDDEVIEHIHEDAKMEEKENENGEKRW